jgi:RNA polymerase sigma-70 factor, ECF subfamily
MSAEGEITSLLLQMKEGDRRAESRLAALVYSDLRRVARKLMSRERPDHTLQPTALVNEAYLRLLAQDDRDWNNRVHFFSVAAQCMRRILVDHARSRSAEKRRGNLAKVDLENACLAMNDRSDEILALDQALDRLAALDPRQSRIVELRFFAGLSEDEIASVMGVSIRTVKREWSFAKAWLKRELGSHEARATESPA